MFTAEKVAQMSACFVAKSGGTLNILKLIKLLYLADRKSMEVTGAPISFDKMVSMRNGPVLSQTLDLINGFLPEDAQRQWEAWISGRDGNHTVDLVRQFDRDDLDQLSDEDLDIVNGVWADFGHMDRFELVDYVHDHCPEWRNPGNSRLPIHERDVFMRGFGMDRDEAVWRQREIRRSQEMDRILSMF